MRVRVYDRAKDEDGAVRIIAQEVPRLPNYLGVVVDEPYLRTRLQTIDGIVMQAWVLVDDADRVHGGSAGFCVPMMISRELWASDLFLFIEQDHRSLRAVRALINAYRTWAIEERKARIVHCTVVGGYRNESIGHLLTRMGAREIGTIYDFGMASQGAAQ